jgi:hypothetical protein
MRVWIVYDNSNGIEDVTAMSDTELLNFLAENNCTQWDGYYFIASDVEVDK